MRINMRVCQISNSKSQIRQIVNDLAILFKQSNCNVKILELVSEKLLVIAIKFYRTMLAHSFHHINLLRFHWDFFRSNFPYKPMILWTFCYIICLRDALMLFQNI